MEFINNTGHIFSLPSFKEKPIGYEYEEFSYIFWFESLNASKLSINNSYIKPIYALYDITNIDIENIDEFLSIEIYFENSNVFSLVSSLNLQDAINDAKNLHEYIRINNLDEHTSFIKDKLTNDDLCVFKTWEQINDHNRFDYIIIPIYVLANSGEEGTWISNMMIHITNNITNVEDWCYISVGGEFIDEYEGLVINGLNMGINLPQDIVKAINKESLYNDVYDTAYYNDKLKEYLLNYMGIRGEMGNFKSAINSLKWFGYGNKLSISKLLKTDNEFMNQYLLDYFDISYDILNSFKKFKSDSLIALRLMTNYETGNWYEFDTNENLFGENNPELESYFEKYIKIKIGNHDMPIEDDPEKYYYWKPYFDFSFNELSIKLALLAYYYNKYFLPIHLNIHSATLGYKVYANDIKMNMLANYGKTEPMIMLNDKENEVEFSDNHLHYFTKQIHIIDDNYNEFDYDNDTINNVDLYEINDTCLSVPIKFKYNKFYNCILILKKIKDNEPLYEYVLNDQIKFYEDLIIKSLDKTYDNEKLMFAYSINDNASYSEYFNGYSRMNDAIMTSCKLSIKDDQCDININMIKNFILESNEYSGTSYYKFNDYIYVITDDVKRTILNEEQLNENNIYVSKVPKKINIKIRSNFKDIASINEYNFNKLIISNDVIIYKKNFSFIQDDTHIYKNFVIYPKHLNISLSKNGERYCSNLYEYWVNKDFTINLLVNNKWYEYDFKSKIDTPILDFGTLNYRYYLNDNNYLLSRMMKNNSANNVHSLFFQHADDHINWRAYNGNAINDMIHTYNMSPNKNLNLINDYLYRYVNTDLTFIRTLDLNDSDALYQYYMSNYNIISNFAQIKNMTDTNVYFNSYMHNKDLVITNNINFDISFIEILNWHIRNNRIYMDESFIDNEFTKSITYKNVKILIHNNIIGNDFYVHNKLIKEFNTISVVKYGDQYVALCQINGSDHYKIVTTELLLNDSIHFIWDENNQSYNIDDENVKYTLEEKIWKSYIDNVTLPKLNKYLNSIHMYGIYKNIDERHDALVFHNNIDMTVNGLVFTHGKYHYNVINQYMDYNSLRFYINGKTELDLIDSRYPDIYGLQWYGENDLFDETKYALSMYGIYIKCQYINEDNYEPIIVDNHYEFTYDDFHYNETSDLIYIGNVIYDNMEAFQINNSLKTNFEEDYKDVELFIENDEYYFLNPQKYDLKDFNKKLKTKLLWKIVFIDDNDNEYDPSIEDVIHNEYKVKVKFYYYDIRLIRNTFVTFKALLNIDDKYRIILPNDNSNIASIFYNDTNILLWEGIPIQVKKGYLYTDKNGNEIRRQNPSMYWYNADSLKYEDLDNALNELKRYWFTEEDTSETIVDHFNKYIYEELTSNNDHRESLRYEYRNYLSKDLTGQEGDFELWWDSNLGDKFNLCVCIERYDGTIDIISEQNSKFILYGNEKNVTAYFRLRCQSLELNNAWIEPHIIKIVHNLERIAYDPNMHTLNDSIKVTFNGKEYEYGDNNDINTLELYKKFFELKYNIWDVYTYNDNPFIGYNKLYSIYDANEYVKLDYNKLDYDLYLMHDNEYWYCLYISKQTCETIYNEDELIIPDELKQFILPIDEETNYYIKYEKSSKEILLNRLEYISTLGKNQFKDDDIICARILNNDRLPYNPYISAKWKISPMSLGMHIDSEFNSNAEMSILSLPKNDNKYQKGYYKVTVKYSLDRDVQHQFKNISTIKVV